MQVPDVPNDQPVLAFIFAIWFLAMGYMTINMILAKRRRK